MVSPVPCRILRKFGVEQSDTVDTVSWRRGPGRNWDKERLEELLVSLWDWHCIECRGYRWDKEALV
jgi:hypothetical protein